MTEWIAAVCSAGCWAASTDVSLVGQMDASTVGYSAVCSAVCWVASTAVNSAARSAECSAALMVVIRVAWKDASREVMKAERMDGYIHCTMCH